MRRFRSASPPRHAPLAAAATSRACAHAALTVAFALVVAAGAAPDARAADVIGSVAGSGSNGFAGDGGPATAALLTSPSDLAPLGNGDAYLIADTSNHRIRRVDAAGLITTVAGAGPCCGATSTWAGDGLSATDPTVRLNQPRGVSATADGGFLIADTGNSRIRKVSAAGVVTTVAGLGSAAFGGDDGPAVRAFLNAPAAVAALPDGGFLIADTGNNRVRLVDASGTINTVAGNDFSADLGDGRLATAASLRGPTAVVPLTGGGFLIADTGQNRIRRVDANGVITTVAGNGTPAGGPVFSGDGGPATAAALNQPEGVAVRPDGSIVISDSTNERVREVDTVGVIRTLAGTGTLGLSGDGGSPAAAQLSHPRGLAVSGSRLRIADASNHRVRQIAPATGGGTTQPPGGGRDPEPPVVTPPGVSPPVIGRSAVATPVSGTILIRLPGTRRFVRLSEVANIPLGSELDARRGRVSLLFATTSGLHGKAASVVASEGRFIVRQPNRLDLGQRPGTLVLSGPLANCRPLARQVRPRLRRSAPLAGTAAKKKRKRKGRRVRVHAQGRIEVSGRYGAAIVRGTRWTTVDRCPRDPRPGTLFVVQEGRVAVTAFVTRRSTLVTKGRRLLAPARRPASARGDVRPRPRARRG
jgi:hypothetical protein